MNVVAAASDTHSARRAPPCMMWSLAPLANDFCFGQSPRWFEGLLWFADTAGEAVHTVNLRGSVTKLDLPGHAPSGLAFSLDGSLLIASAERRGVLRYDGDTVSTVADLATLVPSALGDVVVDHRGRAYIESRAVEGGAIVRLDPDGRATVVADNLEYPNGMLITADGATLIVAEAVGRRLTAMTIGEDGTLTGRRVFAGGLDGRPGGITLDTDGGVWTSLSIAHQFQRITDGGAVTQRIDMRSDRVAVACALGGSRGRTLFLLSSTDAYPESLSGTYLSRLDTASVDVPGVG